MTRVLHPSDWHLGACLYDKPRDEEFAAWLKWLRATIVREKIDVLLIAGDVFDVVNPSNKAREMYFDFLSGLDSDGQCKFTVITAGNHDSAAQLEAPRELLRKHNICVVGEPAASDCFRREVIPVSVTGTDPDLIVCAVPFLSARDVSRSVAGESREQQIFNYYEGVANHYANVRDLALKCRNDAQKPVPVIAMGHLFISGTKTSDGERNFVGNLGGMPADVFGTDFDYIALGHLHVPQTVGNNPMLRYSGSPIAISCSECHAPKTVCIISFGENAATPEIETIQIPSFRKIRCIEGSEIASIMHEIDACIEESVNDAEKMWIAVKYKGNDIRPNLSKDIRDKLKKTNVECLNVENDFIRTAYIASENAHSGASLGDVTPEDVFRKLLDARNISGAKADDYIVTFKAVFDAVSRGELK